MEAQKTVLAEMEESMKKLSLKSADIDSQIMDVVSEIQSVTEKLSATEEVVSLSQKKMDLLKQKKKLEEDLRAKQAEMKMLKNSSTLIKEKRFPVKHPNMPYIESAMEKMGDDVVENDTDYDDAKSDAFDSDNKYTDFVPHPNINLNRDSEYTKKMQNKPYYVPHPNIRMSRLKEFRDFESEQVALNSSFEAPSERKISSAPIIKPMRSKMNCSCIQIDEDILQKCQSMANCKACSNAFKAYQPSEKVGCHSKISFSPGTAISDGVKSVPKLKGASSVMLNCKSFAECADCAKVLKKTKSHLATCMSYNSCKNCAALKSDPKKEVESEMSEVSTKSSYFEDSCSSFQQCRDCEIARQVKKVEAKRKIAETPRHKHCSESFCIPYFVKQCSERCSCKTEAPTSIRPVTAPIIQDLQSPSTVQASKSFHKISTSAYPKESYKTSSEFCTTSEQFNENTPTNHDLQVYQALLHANSVKSINPHTAFSSPKIQQKNSQNSRDSATVPSLCKSYAYCLNCNCFTPVATIPSEMLSNYENAVKSCKSVNTCKNCRQMAMSTLNKRQSMDVSTSENDGVNQSTSELKKVNRQSLPEEKKSSYLLTTPMTDTSTESETNLDWKKSSVLNECKSFGVCAKCMQCIWQQTVATECNSEPECKLCAHVMESIDDKQRKEYQAKKLRNSSLHRDSKISRSMKVAISKGLTADNSSSSSTKTPTTDNSGDSSKSYEQMKLVIEKQNEVIRKIQEKIRSNVSRRASEESVIRLANTLGEAKVKLRKLVQLAMIEQKKHQDENWKPITVSLIDDF